MFSLMTVSIFGFAILGAFTYHYDDNSDVSFSDIVEDYYPEDLNQVFIALALVIPVVLPIRLVSYLTGTLNALPVAFFILILIGSIVRVFTMGAMIRWTLSYHTFTPFKLPISEFILATVVHFA
jgi:hypothetical protein